MPDHRASQEPGSALVPALPACPVATAAEPAAELEALPVTWTVADDESLAVDRLFDSAERFITLFHTENRAGPPDRRLWRVRREIDATGTYWHTPAELAFGARVAWRNSSRCIGRLYWRSLRVRDRREVTAAPDIAAESVAHLREATNDGRIRPVITVFAPDAPGRPGPRILSSQLVRYAGYDTADGAVIGDPTNTGHHPPGPRARLVGRLAGRPVRHPPPDRPGSRGAAHAARACPPTRCSR